MNDREAIAFERRRQRWMRPDAARYLRPDWRSRKYWTRSPVEASMDGANNAAAVWSGKSVEAARTDDGGLSLAELRSAQARIAHLRWLLADLKFHLVLRRIARKANFDPNQPRVSAGSREGGQWTDAGGGGGGSSGRARFASSDKPRLGPKSKLAIAIEVGKQAIKLFRDQNLLNNLFGQKEGTVTYTNMGDVTVYGVNSESPAYKDRDAIAAERLRGDLIAKYPRDMATQNTGQMPNNAVFHAETTVLLRAARANGGSLAGQNLEVHIDRPMCPSCDTILPLVGLELGDPTVTFIGPSGVPKTMRGGIWVK